jgi:hypothetical protein
MILKKRENDKEITCLIESSNIIGSIYNFETETLTIIFKRGATYSYKNVYRLVYEGFESAQSQGKYFNQFIKSIPATLEESTNIDSFKEYFNLIGDTEFQELRTMMYNISVDITSIDKFSIDLINDFKNKLDTVVEIVKTNYTD